MSTLIEVNDLLVEAKRPSGKTFPIVKGLSFFIRRGEILAFIGESGSGKTTASLAVMGYARPGCSIKSGSVIFDGTNLLSLKRDKLRDIWGRRISYVAQSAADAFNPALSIGTQVIEPIHIHRTMSGKEGEAHAHQLYRKLQLPQPDLIGKRYPHQVSGGQLQRLLAAMSLVCDPDLLILDEPTTALDVTTQVEVLGAFKELICKKKTSAIYISHDLSVVAQIADRIIVFNEGKMVEHGETSEIIRSPSAEYTKILIGAVRQPPNIEVHTIEKESETQSIKNLDVLLDARGITAGYGRQRKTTVLRDVNLTVRPGSVVGIVGESGCGKSTLARVIAGLLPPTSGTIELHGRTLHPNVANRSRDELKLIQIVFQMADVALNPRHRIGDILSRPLNFYGIYEIKDCTKRVAELLELVELRPEHASRIPRELSGGQKQRVNLARALAAEPELVLCDEIISSLDTVVGKAIIELLEELKMKLNLSYIFISHDLSTVASFADYISVMYAGQIVESGRKEDVFFPPSHPYTQLLIASVPEMRCEWLDEIMETQEAVAGILKDIHLHTVGCRFWNRCPLFIERLCDHEPPPERLTAEDHIIRCHREISDLHYRPK